MSDTVESDAETALVEVSPGTALLFGRLPEGLELTDFTLISDEDKVAIANAVAAASSILNVGGQLANGFAQAQGLIRLAPETLNAMQAGATPIKSGGYFLGTLRQGGQFSNSVRWLPASGVTAAGVIASVGPAIAMLAIQVQLSELSSLVRENLALTEVVLKSVRHEQWAELTGLEQAVTKALSEAKSVGHVTPLLWENISGYEADLRKHRDLFRRHVEAHSTELGQRTGHKERRQYIEKSGEAILLDLHSLLIAHRTWFEYQALRAGRAKLGADADPREAKLLQAIIDNANDEYGQIVEQMSRLLDTLNRELWILAELPGKRTLPFTGSRRSANDVAEMAERLQNAVEKLTHTATPPAPLDRPETHFVHDLSDLDNDLRILRWHMARGESLEGIAIALETHPGAALESFGSALKGVGAAVARGADGNAKAFSEVATGGLKGLAQAHVRGVDGLLKAVAEPGTEMLIAVTDQRVLIAELAEFRQQGVLRHSVQNDRIRFVRLRNDNSNGRPELDLITEEENLAWRFPRGTASAEPVQALVAMLADRGKVQAAEPKSISPAT